MRRHLLVRVGVLEAAALAAAQPRDSAAGSSRRSSTATWSRPCCAASPIPPGAAQRLRHGPQVDVERGARRPAARGLPGRRRSAARGRAREDRRPLRDLRHAGRPPDAPSGRPGWGCAPAFPIPVGAFDAHWDAIGAGVRLGDVVNVIGTSTCIIAVSDKTACVPGLCGVVPGLGPSRADRHRGRALGDRRHLRRDRAPRRHVASPRCPTASAATAPARPACCT